MIVMPVDYTHKKYMVIARIKLLPTVLGKRARHKVEEIFWMNTDLPYMKRILQTSISDIYSSLENDYYDDKDILTEYQAIGKIFENEDLF